MSGLPPANRGSSAGLSRSSSTTSTSSSSASGMNPPSKRARGLVLVGEKGRKTVRKGMTTSTDPSEFIDRLHTNAGFSQDNPCTPGLDLLRLLDVTRSSACSDILSGLVDNFVRVLDSGVLGENQMLKILSITFPYIYYPEVRAIPVATMMRLHPRVPRKLYQMLGKKELPEGIPMSIQRRVWLEPTQALQRKLKPIFLALAFGEQASFDSQAMPKER